MKKYGISIYKKLICIMLALMIVLTSLPSDWYVSNEVFAATINYGDSNGDGRINVMDAVLMKKHIAGFEGLTINLDAVDVNVDGKINVMDAVMVLKYIAGFDVVLGNGSGDEVLAELPPMTEDEITLTYSFWQDIEISDALAEEFMQLYPNIKVVNKQFDVGSNNDELWALAATEQLPDCFWVLGAPDQFIGKCMLYDMTAYWNADPETDNIIKGINEFKLGYFGTDSKWVTPVKFYPTAAFLNLDVFIRNDKEMPAMEWTWDEFEATVEDMTITSDKENGYYIFGHTSGCTVITWYPLASDKECIGEFGWNGTEYDMENWAYGLQLESEWIDKGYKPIYLDWGGYEDLVDKYGDKWVLYPQDQGYSAIHTDNWWTWEDYWSTDPWIIDNKVVFVPYMMPHTEDAQDGNYIATMDMGGISAFTEYPREAYELLKFMTWGAEGWQYKLKHYPNLTEESTGNDRAVSKNNCPITLDEEVWDGFAKWHPNSEIGDEYITDMYGEEYDRSEYFDYFMEKVQNSTWTCYGSQQIPGFDIWLQDVYYDYNGEEDYGYDDRLGIEAACILGDTDAYDYYEYLGQKGTEISRETSEELEETMSNMDPDSFWKIYKYSSAISGNCSDGCSINSISLTNINNDDINDIVVEYIYNDTYNNATYTVKAYFYMENDIVYEISCDKFFLSYYRWFYSGHECHFYRNNENNSLKAYTYYSYAEAMAEEYILYEESETGELVKNTYGIKNNEFSPSEEYKAYYINDKSDVDESTYEAYVEEILNTDGYTEFVPEEIEQISGPLSSTDSLHELLEPYY